MVQRCLLVCAFLLALASAAPSRASIIQDDFRSYTQGDDGHAHWDAGWAGWAVNGGVFESDGRGRSMAVRRDAPHGRHLVVEATVTPRQAVDTEWKVAGIAIAAGDGDYWHLALVSSPDSQGSRHSAELAEMVGGRWLAHIEGPTRLQTESESGSLRWEPGRPYRFRIEIDEDGITGSIRAEDGTDVLTRRMRFSAPGVRSGRPALLTSGMAAGFADFRAEITLGAAAPPARVYPRYQRTGRPLFVRKATGYFRVEKVDGRWWMIDPSGAPFYAVGTDHANYNAHFCEKLGYAPYARNVAARYGSEAKWAASTAARLKAWGFNALGAGCGESVRYRGLPHTEFLSLGSGFTAISDIAPRTTWTGFPDVFHPKFRAYCEFEARRRCAQMRMDPWLIGYFLDNELEWFGKNGSDGGLVDETMKKPADHPAKRALLAFLSKRYPSIEGLNRAWGVHAGSYDELAGSTVPLSTATAAGKRDRLDFVRLIADRYFAITSAAIRKADPNHMVIGCRFAGYAPDVWDVAGRYLDIVSVNYYGQVDLDRGVSTDMPGILARYYARALRPLMITEWSFPALDAGLPSQHGAGQRVATQKDKARAISIYQRKLFSMPFMVGSDYFMWVDEPALGISSTFPEDSNYGLVDVNDDPWPDVTRTIAHVNRWAGALHSGNAPALSVSIAEPAPGTALVRVRNSGGASIRCPLVLWVQGARTQRTVAVPARGSVAIRLRVNGIAYVAARLDPLGQAPQADELGNSAERTVGLALLHKPAIVVTNPTDASVANAPVTVQGAERLAGLRPVDAGGAPLPAQIDRLPSGAELSIRVPSVRARSVAVVRLARGSVAQSSREETGDRRIDMEGDLRLEHDAGGRNLFDRVSLGGVLLGRFNALANQSGRQMLWTAPDTVEKVVSWTGPVRNVLELTAGLGSEGARSAKTAAGDAGAYAPQQSTAPLFQMSTRIARWSGESWFSARVLSVRNTDTAPWQLRAYYLYPLSSIAGRAEDDRAAGTADTPLWFDDAAGLGYGAVVDMRRMKVSFWKDTPDGPGEHPDIWREIGRDLSPGQTLRVPAGDPDTLLFGTRGTPKSPGGETLSRLRALGRIRTSVLR